MDNTKSTIQTKEINAKKVIWSLIAIVACAIALGFIINMDYMFELIIAGR